MKGSKGGRHGYIEFFKGEVVRETNVAVWVRREGEGRKGGKTD